ncbi:HEPN domain-containing protein [Gloeocapsopsis sp. IPPAS B-1203]|uniref:HEPN domain-containing protein n=1 Tax=Gloeocapsopsis sp. IPPAS B-1203 TaxID=2049454 RepID=UPI000C1845F1|nr:HEPN domain-containing protein [Gloeocapsopsis sp. IPPAS B-1203]PIG95466.1 DNA-binding protein [Gloeocapsopsis sp. IPPAS B-1203]
MTPQQQALLQKAARSIQSAIMQNESDFSEFAASRAYYAMFYVACAYLEGEGLAFSSHSAVIAAFGQRFARTQRVPAYFHRHLINAMDVRTKADYNVEPNITKEDAAQLIIRAQEFLEFAQQNMNYTPQ